MDEALEAGESQDRLPRETLVDTNPAAHDQENRQQGKHADDGDTADDRQFAAVEVAPVAPGGLNKAGGHRIGDRYPSRDLVALLQRIQELVFLNGFGRGLEGKLGGCGTCENEQQRERGEQRPEPGELRN